MHKDLANLQSQAGLDRIITQLMEQTQGSTAAPPAPEEVIDKLAVVKATKEVVESDKDCSICKDSFSLDDPTVTLPCTHL